MHFSPRSAGRDLENVPARAVNVHVQVAGTGIGEVLDQILGGNSEESYFVVNAQFGRLAGPGAGLDLIPVVAAWRRLASVRVVRNGLLSSIGNLPDTGRTAVLRLLGCRCPAHIPGLVIAVVVDPVEGRSFRPHA